MGFGLHIAGWPVEGRVRDVQQQSEDGWAEGYEACSQVGGDSALTGHQFLGILGPAAEWVSGPSSSLSLEVGRGNGKTLNK
jgi:hypothetical protein